MSETGHAETYLQSAIADGHAEITGEGRNERIHYIASDHSERWADPEEKVRAELWAELIYKYEYQPERIAFEVTIPGRTPNNSADLVVCNDDELKSPYFVFECKRADVSDATFDQSIEQACGYRASLGAKYCGAVAGLTRRLLRFDKFPPGERDRNHLTDIPIHYGHLPEWRFYKGPANRDLAAVPREELRAAIRKCHQTLWEGGRRSPIAAFGEFSKLVFIKHRDEKDLNRQLGQPYAFQRRLSETASELANRINRLYNAEQQREPDVFTDRISVEAPILAQCVEHLEGISLDRTELDTKGVAFEEFMGSFFKGDFGQYFTPRELIAFSVAVLDPKRTDLVLDPACGSGGFLLYTLDHVRREADKVQTPGTVTHFQYWHDFAEKNLYGIEVNDELARVAKMNMIIHDDGHTNIVGHDALDFPQNIYARNAGLAAGKFDLILTNPPFGAVIKRTEKGDGYLEQFDLMRYLSKDYPLYSEIPGDSDETDTRLIPKSVKPRASIKTEIAFIERIHSFLKPGSGRAAVVLPDGILTNSSLQGVRHWLLNHFQLLAVVSLPQFAFQHYDAGVKASIVFLRRLAEGETVPDDEPIFMALAENIGYDATGRKTFNVTVESEEPGKKKVEIHSCDLFDYRVTYEWSEVSPKEADWSERRREVIPSTGLVAQWEAFQKNPKSFFLLNTDGPKTVSSYTVNHREVKGHSLGASYYAPELQLYLNMLRSNPAATKLLSEYVEVNPSVDISEIEDEALVGFIPMESVSDGATGEYTVTARPLNEVRKGYTCFMDGDILWAKSTPCMQNGKSCIVDGLPNGVGFGATEFHVLRVRNPSISGKFVFEFVSQEMLRSVATYTFSGSAGQQRVPSTFLENLPFPELSKEHQEELVAVMESARAESYRLRAEAESGWREAKKWFEEQLLRPNTL